MQAGTAEEKTGEEFFGGPQDTEYLLDSSLVAANEETSKIEETAMTDPEDLEEQEQTVKRAKAAKKAAGRPRITSARKPPVKTATKAKRATNGDAKASLAIDEGTKRLVRKLRAQMELESGERVSFAAAISAAVEKALE